MLDTKRLSATMFVPTMTRFLVAAIALCGLVHVAVARPLNHPSFGNSGLTKRELLVGDALASLVEREPLFESELDLEARLFDDEESELFVRKPPASSGATRAKGTPKQERAAGKAPKQTKTNAAPAKVNRGAQQPAKHKALPNNTKIRLSDDARGELNKMGLHGKDRRKEIKYHKNAVKKEMKKQGAATAEIKHVAHRGGSDPKEKNHITASLYAKKQPGDTGRNGKIIPNKFNGGPNHHIYVNSKGTSQASKKGHAKNDADIKGQSKSYQTQVSKTPTAGKSSTKGKGRQNPTGEFTKNKNKLGTA